MVIFNSYVKLPEGTWNCYFAGEIRGISEVPKAYAFITWQETTFLGRICFNPRINRPFGSICGLADKAQILLVDSWVYHRFDVTSPSR